MTTETLVTAQGKKQICCETTIELNDEQFEKLTDNRLAKRVDSIIKELHIDWAINVQSGKNILSVTRTTTGPIDDEYRHNLEIAATNFMSAVEELQCKEPVREAECPSHESNNTEEGIRNLEFVKKLLNDINLPLDNDRHVCGAFIIDTTTHPFCPELTGWGSLSYDLLKEMCELYLAAHNK